MAVASLAVAGAEFIANRSNSDGGGIYLSAGALSVTNALFARNYSGSGRGAAMVFGANLCPGYDTLMVTVVEPPTVELIAPVAVDIDGGSVTFDGGTPPGGSYMIGDDETSTVDPITYNVGDSIVVVYSYTEPLTGCTGSDTAYVLVEQITSIDAAPGDTVVHVAPNPAHGHCIVRLAIDDVGRFTLLDALGRTARAWAPRRTPALLDLSGLPGGSYLLRVETPEGSTHHRLALE